MDAGSGAMEDDVRVQDYMLAGVEVNRKEGARPNHGGAGMRRVEKTGGTLSAVRSGFCKWPDSITIGTWNSRISFPEFRSFALRHV